jgi:hypothetical protein
MLMSFVCGHDASFSQNIQLPNIVGDVCFNHIDISNETIRARNLIVDNSLIIQNMDIKEKVLDLSNNVIVITDDSLSTTSNNKLKNNVFTNAINGKQDIISDLSTNGFLSAGTNISFSILNSLLSISKSSSSGNPVYFLTYHSTSFTNSYAGPKNLQLDTIYSQYPTTGTITSDYAYIIQESGLYKLSCQVRIIDHSKQTQCGIAIKRNGTIFFPVIGGIDWNTSSHNSIIYPCLQDDEVSIRTTHFTIFDEYTAIYGSTSTGNNPTPNGALNTHLYGIKIG